MNSRNIRKMYSGRKAYFSRAFSKSHLSHATPWWAWPLSLPPEPDASLRDNSLRPRCTSIQCGGENNIELPFFLFRFQFVIIKLKKVQGLLETIFVPLIQ